MKKNFLLLFWLLCFYTNANAWFFFFIPSSVTRGAADAITGAKGNICVRETAKVDDVVPSVAGNTMRILSLSGTSSMCSNPALPIRADVEFTFTFKSNAGVNLPDEYEAKTLTDLQRYNGILLLAASKTTRNKGVVISAREKKENADPQGLASSVEKIQINNLAEGVSNNAEQLKVNSQNAWRFEVHGKTKGVFGTEMVYIITIIEGDSEILVVNAYTAQSNYEKDKDELRKIAMNISGIAANATTVNVPVANPSPKVGEAQSSITAPAVETTTNTSQTGNKLRELSKMLSEGLITQQDYETKKAELLKNL